LKYYIPIIIGIILLIEPITALQPNQDKVFLRIPINEKDLLPPRTIIIGGSPGKYLDVLLSSNIRIPGIMLSMNPSDDGYPTFDEMEDELRDIASNYSNITMLTSIGRSWEGRDIWCLEVSDNPGVDEDEPGVLFMGLHHAREWPTVEICLFIAKKLTSNYGLNSTITDLVDNRRIWIIPCVNPDGYVYDHDIYHGEKWWRKNRRYIEEYDTYGIDLNRNYAGSCNGDPVGEWGSIGYASVSHHPPSEVYCGSDIFSENETKAIKDFIINNDINALITYHTYSELVMWPWGYSSKEKAPDDVILSKIGIEIASEITKQDDTGTYEPIQSANLYPTTGDTTDWAYGYSHYILGRPLFPYTIEACSSFHPPHDVIEQVCRENFDGAIVLIREALNISMLPRRVTPPRFYSAPIIDNDGDYIISWIEDNSASRYQLDELKDLDIIDDDGSHKNLWELDGFQMVNTFSHSSSQSYGASRKNNEVVSMTTRYPLPVISDTKLSFWCYYDIEEDYDKAFVEISENGRLYEILDSFTGSSNGWIYKEYDLSSYANSSIYIRFRYTTDDLNLGDGFFIDDITPVPFFNDITVISRDIHNEWYHITNHSQGIYYYRVRGYNEPYGWGDYSSLKTIYVNTLNNTPPLTPTITGSKTGKPGEELEYNIKTTDPDGDDVYYYIDWGDNTTSDWIGPYKSGEKVTVSHTWNEKGSYTIRVKAKDIYDTESDWCLFKMGIYKNIIIYQLSRILSYFNLKLFFKSI